MTEVSFHETRMGVRYFEHTVPELVSAIDRLAAAMERIADLHAPAGSQQPRKEDDHDSEEDSQTR